MPILLSPVTLHKISKILLDRHRHPNASTFYNYNFYTTGIVAPNKCEIMFDGRNNLPD